MCSLARKGHRAEHHSEMSENVTLQQEVGDAPLTRREERKRRKEGSKQQAGDVTGHITLELTFFPFRGAEPPPRGPEQGEGPAAAGTAPGADAASSPQSPPGNRALNRLPSLRRAGTPAPDEDEQGVVSVSVNRCVGLESEVDSHVVVTVTDPAQHGPGGPRVIEFSSSVVLEETNPHYRFKADFVGVSARSVLVVAVYAEPGAISSTLHKLPFVKHAKPKQIGYVQMDIDDLLKESRITDRFPLQEAQTGEMDMSVQWTPIAMDD